MNTVFDKMVVDVDLNLAPDWQGYFPANLNSATTFATPLVNTIYGDIRDYTWQLSPVSTLVAVGERQEFIVLRGTSVPSEYAIAPERLNIASKGGATGSLVVNFKLYRLSDNTLYVNYGDVTVSAPEMWADKYVANMTPGDIREDCYLVITVVSNTGSFKGLGVAISALYNKIPN